jgi:hypothetical protein
MSQNRRTPQQEYRRAPGAQRLPANGVLIGRQVAGRYAIPASRPTGLAGTRIHVQDDDYMRMKISFECKNAHPAILHADDRPAVLAGFVVKPWVNARDSCGEPKKRRAGHDA